MERNERALVPEWLNVRKAKANQPDIRNRPLLQVQNSGPSFIEEDASRKRDLRERSFQKCSTTNWNCTRNKDAFVHQRTCYSFNQRPSSSGHDEHGQHDGHGDVKGRMVNGYDKSRRVNGYDKGKTGNGYDRDITVNENNKGRIVNRYHRDKTVKKYNKGRILNGYDRNRQGSWKDGDRKVNGEGGRYQERCSASYQPSNSRSASRVEGNKILKNGSANSGDMSPSASSCSTNIQSADFDTEFPLLGTEKKHDCPNQAIIWQQKAGRPNSVRPLLGSTVSGALAEGTTGNGIFEVEGQVSVLADNLQLGLSRNDNFCASTQVIASGGLISSKVPGAASMGGLNMAETLAQNLSRVCTSPKLISETQKLEELALKQSKSLIPVVHSATKTMCPSQKLKMAPSGAKLFSARAPREPRIPERTETGQGKNPLKADNLGSSKLRSLERNDFFNALRKKDAQNLFPVTEVQDDSTTSTKSEKVVCVIENENNEISGTMNDVICERTNFSVKDMDNPLFPESMNHSSFVGSSERDEGPFMWSLRWGSSEQDEVAFMRSLGWDENAQEKPLAEEEISSFYKQHIQTLNAIRQGKHRLQFTEVCVGSVVRMTPTINFPNS